MFLSKKNLYSFFALSDFYLRLNNIVDLVHAFSKSEFVIYKLKEMGNVAEKDILQICNQYDLLDRSKCGKITLADLMESD